MGDWVEINLPWNPPELPRFPEVDLSKEILEKFGVLEAPMDYSMDLLFNLRDRAEVATSLLDTEETLGIPHELRVQNKMYEIATAEELEHLEKKRAWRKLQKDIDTWKHEQPAVQAQYDAEATAREENRKNGFRHLARPGIQIELADGKRYLIGDINPLRGVCDDCTGFEGDAIVKRYRVLCDPAKD